MPTILPIDDAVTWPATEGTLGVVGVAPWATLDFLRSLYGQVRAARDWHYPRVLCDLNPKLPSRGRHLELGERDPSPFIAATIAELARQGATAAVVPCNTAHVLYSRWAADAPIPVPCIVQATTAVLQAGSVRRAAVCGSRSLLGHGLYQRSLEAAGIEAVALLDGEIELVQRAIAAVKTDACIPEALRALLETMLTRLARLDVDGLVLGCTELAALEPLARAYLPAVAESNAALATAALRAIGAAPPHAAIDRTVET